MFTGADRNVPNSSQEHTHTSSRVSLFLLLYVHEEHVVHTLSLSSGLVEAALDAAPEAGVCACVCVCARSPAAWPARSLSQND